MVFIGQQRIISYVENALPRFIILKGQPHHGKRTLAEYLAKYTLNCQVAITESSLDGVRNIVDISYRVIQPTCYIFPNADDMSSGALNALLKVTEEPPKQSYFILCCSSSTLDTLISRACVFTLLPYSKGELQNFADNERALFMCDSPGELAILGDKADELYNFCHKVVTALPTVSGVNALKIPGYLKLKDEQEGYDLHLFLKGIRLVLWETVDTRSYVVTIKALALTAKADENTQRKSVRKDSIVDNWVLDMRTTLRGE